jgi:tetratricopeptide (TPR) repeat protein
MATRLDKKQVLFLISATLAAGVLVAYEPIRHNDFVNYDDDSYITKNPHINQGITQQSVLWAFTEVYSANWHPLTWLSHILDYQLFGLNPVGHHFVSVVLHIVNALLLFWILTNITGVIWPSAFVAAVFALHPIQVESVAWVAERKTAFSGLFWLLTMAAYIHYTRRPGVLRYVLLLLIYGLCVMTKPTVVTLPFALFLLDYWPLGRLQWGQEVTNNPKKSGQSKVSSGWLIIEKIPLLALSAILSAITFLAQRQWGAVISLEKMPLENRVANMFVSYIRYIGKLIWPSGLAVCYPHPRVSVSDYWVVICAVLFILLCIFSIYICRRRKYAAAGWLWFVGTLVPAIGLVQTGTQAMANRYMYIPMLGLLIIISWGVKDYIDKQPRAKIAAIILGVAVLFSLLVLTRMQVRHWQNSMTLYEYALKVTQNNALAENNYGSALFEAGRLDEAISHLNKALLITPKMAEAEDNLGRVYLKQGKAGEAVACFMKVIENNRTSAEVYSNLGSALIIQKKYDEALKYLGKAMELDPNNPDIHNIMGMVLLSTGRPGEAITHFNYVLQTNTISAEAYANLGSAYIKMDNYEPAIENLTKAIELKPNNIGALNNLAWALATVENTSLRDANRAIEYARHACELTGNKEAGLLDTLAVAYAAGGRFEEAKATAEKALSIAKEMGREELAGKIENRIKLYEAGKPYRQK